MLGVDGPGVDALVLAAVRRQALVAGVEHDPRGVVPVGARVGQDVHGERGEGSVATGPQAHPDAERVPGRQVPQRVLARGLVDDGPAEAEDREATRSSTSISCLPPKPRRRGR